MTKAWIDQISGHEGAVEKTLSDNRDIFLGFLTKRLGSRNDAEDILQEFCIRVLERKKQLRDAERMDAWLFAILRSTLTDHYRKSSRQSRAAEAYALEPQELTDDLYDSLTRFCTCGTGLVSFLRPSDAELIHRIDFGEDDRAAVAVDLGLTRGALGVRLHRARSAFREALLKHCGLCCRTGLEDCYCEPVGCNNPEHQSHCGANDGTAH